MTVYTYKEVYNNNDVLWDLPAGTPINNGVPVGTSFTLNGAGSSFDLQDDDTLLEDNNGVDHIADSQSLDLTQQVLVNGFGSNAAGDYVWSRAYQNVVDSDGNVGRIYQIRMGTWTGNGMPDYNTSNLHQYYVFSGPLKIAPGVTYTVTGGFNASGNQAHETFKQPVCFARGVRIETARGMVAVEDLQIGDLVRTKANGFKPVMWINSQVLDEDLLAVMPHLRPIRVGAGALGQGRPEREIRVSPQHRLVVRNHLVERMFETEEVLVAAKHLLGAAGIDRAADGQGVEYFHFLLDRHEIVYAEGAETESLYTGPEALKSLSAAARIEVFTLFPELAALDHDALPLRAGEFITGRRARHLVARAAKNGIALSL